MVENRPFGNALAHLILIAGVLVIVFPVYMAFIASTWDAATIANGKLGLLPGPHLICLLYTSRCV